VDVYGGDVSSAGEILHGKTSPLKHDAKGVYAGLSQDLPVTRYHSLAGTHETLPECLELTSYIVKDDGSKGVIMGVRHKEFTIEGVQFHPESILSADGRLMIKNFLHMQGGTWAENERLQKLAATAGTNGVDGEAKKPSPQNNILQKIYSHRKEAVATQKKVPSQRPEDLQAAYHLGAAPPQISFVDRLRQSPFDVSLMAEIKRASPSKGIFALDINAPTQAKKYALAGASVISILTEPEWFKGSIEDLRSVRQVLNAMPNRPALLRKEFIFDEYQILEARLAGADTVLLIVKMLDNELLSKLYKYSVSLGMEPLVEVQTADEMTKAVKLGAKVIGVNNRNLENFEVDLNTTSQLRSMVPKDTILCALSGINTRQDIVAYQEEGVGAVLVGEALMRAPDASLFVKQLCSGAPTSPPPAASAKPLLVKICGTRSAEAASEAVKAGADMIGIILVPGSRRCVSDDVAVAISKAVHSHPKRQLPKESSVPSKAASDYFNTTTKAFSTGKPLLVGVFLNQPLDYILEKQRLYDLDVVQLHGNEPLEWASLIPVPIIKMFKPGAVGLGARGFHDVPLLDSGAGSGKLLDASAVQQELKRDRELSVLLAGGLNPENVAESVASLQQYSDQVLGVDVSSGVEVDGEPSLELIRDFVRVAKAFRG